MVDKDIRKIQEGKIPGDNFDWNTHEIEIDSANLNETDVDKSSDTPYIVVLQIAQNIFIFSLILRLWRYVLGENDFTVCGANLNEILNIFIIYFGLFLVLTLILRGISAWLTVADCSEFAEKYKRVGRLSVICLWLIFSYLKSSIIKKEATFFYSGVKRILKAGVVTCVVFIFVTMIMISFEDFFIKKSLKSKITEVEKTEKILRRMIKFRYGTQVEESTSSVSEQGCGDIFCINLFGYNRPETDDSIDLDNPRKYGTVTIKPPALLNISSCLELAKECFTKAANGENELSFELFAKIFPTTKQALRAFAYFDSDQDRSISKKEFRDTVVYFFRDREVLEQSIKSTKDFVRIISRIFSAFAFIFLVVAYLMIFGVSFKELMAVVLSSALAFNFVASGLLAETYRNIVMLLSHQFDIGDDVVVGGQDLRVFKVGLSSTSFINVHGGKIKYLNSDLWNQTIINMTKAPEKILVFSFTIPSTTTPQEIAEFKERVHKFIIKKIFDYHDNFKLISENSSDTSIDQINCSLVLKCKGYKNNAKKFVLRVEFTSFLQSALKDLKFNQ